LLGSTPFATSQASHRHKFLDFAGVSYSDGLLVVRSAVFRRNLASKFPAKPALQQLTRINEYELKQFTPGSGSRLVVCVRVHWANDRSYLPSLLRSDE